MIVIFYVPFFINLILPFTYVFNKLRSAFSNVCFYISLYHNIGSGFRDYEYMEWFECMAKRDETDKEIIALKTDADDQIRFVSKEMKLLRKDRKLTVMEVSIRSGIAYGYVSDIENGKHMKIALNTIIRYCKALNEDHLSLLSRAHMKYLLSKEQKEADK